MNRCVPQALTAWTCPLLSALALAALPAAAQTGRPFPANALRGELQITQPPEALLNGDPVRLAPGARIRGANNMMQMSAALAGQDLLVHYTRDPQGLLFNIWILTPEEAANKPWPHKPEQAERWLFNPAAQTWTRR